MNIGTGLTTEQHEVLLKDLSAARIAKRKGGNGKELSYLEAWDVKAHLIRIFGFGGWSWTVSKAELAFEEQNDKHQWQVGYRVIGTLYVHTLACEYAEAAVGSSTQPSRGEAHDMAIKTAESDALKRAAINLGTQFGLSLYNNGERRDVIRHTLVGPDIQRGVRDDQPGDLDSEVVENYVKEIATSNDEVTLKEIYDACCESAVIDLIAKDGETVRAHIYARLNILRSDDAGEM